MGWPIAFGFVHFVRLCVLFKYSSCASIVGDTVGTVICRFVRFSMLFCYESTCTRLVYLDMFLL